MTAWLAHLTLLPMTISVSHLSLGLRSKFNIFYCYIFYRIARGLTSDNVKGLFVGLKTGQAFFPIAVFSGAIHYQ